MGREHLIRVIKRMYSYSGLDIASLVACNTYHFVCLRLSRWSMEGLVGEYCVEKSGQ